MSVSLQRSSLEASRTGYIDATDAEDAVRKLRAIPGEEYHAIASAIEGAGPQPKPGEVRAFTGAI